jgi:hypothetical protein
MNNNRNLFFPNNETCVAALISSRSKTGAKMDACVDKQMWPISQTKKMSGRTKYLSARRGIERPRVVLKSRKALLLALTLSLGLVVVLQRKEVQVCGHGDPDLLATK